MQTQNPVQPVYEDEDETLRFKGNEAVKFLWENTSEEFTLNFIRSIIDNEEDFFQFLQLLGKPVHTIDAWTPPQSIADRIDGQIEKDIG